MMKEVHHIIAEICFQIHKMFLTKMRLISPLFQRNSMVNATIRSSKINFPTITLPMRAYSRFIEDDDEDMLAPKNKFQSMRNSDSKSGRFGGSGYTPRSGNSGRPSFGGNRTGGNRYGVDSYGGNRFGGKNFGGNQGFGQELGKVDWSTVQLDDIRKDFYQPSEITQNRSGDEIQDFQTKHEITISQSAPKPIFTFEELRCLPEPVMNVIKKQGFSQCTPIQAQGMPIALSGKNMVGIAQTGYEFVKSMVRNMFFQFDGMRF